MEWYNSETFKRNVITFHTNTLQQNLTAHNSTESERRKLEISDILKCKEKP